MVQPGNLKSTAWMEPVREVQSRVVDAAILLISLLGLPWLVAAVMNSGWEAVTVLELMVFLVLLGVGANLRRLSFRFKSTLVILAGLLIGSGVLLSDGLNSRSGLYFLAVSVFSALVLGPKIGYWIAIGSTALTVACGLGWIPHGTSGIGAKVFWPGWALPLFCLSMLLVTAGARVFAALRQSIIDLLKRSQRLEATQESLEREISERIKAQEELSKLNAELDRRVNESHQELRIFKRAIEQSPISVVITDPKGTIEYVNSAFVNITGYQREDVIGKNPRLLKSGKTSPKVYTKMWSTILSHMTWHGEFINRRKSGEEYIEEAWIAPVMDAGGNVLKFVGVKKDITKVKELEEALRLLSHTDANTGVANRRHFDQVLAAEISRARRSGSPLSLVMIDIDFFKSFNDRFGHQAGDDCLRAVADTLRGVARRTGDLVARYGGEEFALILSSTDSQAARGIAEEARLQVEKLELNLGEQTTSITISAGCCTVVPQAGTTASDLMRKADDALYRAKRDGRNRVEGGFNALQPKGQEPAVLYAF